MPLGGAGGADAAEAGTSDIPFDSVATCAPQRLESAAARLAQVFGAEGLGGRVFGIGAGGGATGAGSGSASGTGATTAGACAGGGAVGAGDAGAASGADD